jgi:hypothetical protein
MSESTEQWQPARWVNGHLNTGSSPERFAKIQKSIIFVSPAERTASRIALRKTVGCECERLFYVKSDPSGVKPPNSLTCEAEILTD